MSDNLDPLDQLIQQEQQQKADAAQIVGEHQATTEQDDYQAQIDQRRAQQPITTYAQFEAMRRASEPGWAQAIGDFEDSAITHLGNIGLDVWAGIARMGGSVSGLFPGADAEAQRAAGERLAALPENIHNALTGDNLQVPNSTPDRMVANVAQFTAGFAPARGLALAAGAPAWLAGVGAAGAAGYADFDPNDPRLSNLIQAHPALSNPVTEFLATQPGDTEAEGRLKNGVEQAAFGGMADTLVDAFGSVLKAMRATKAINEATAAIEATPSTPVTVPERAPAAATTGEPTATPQASSEIPADTPQAQPVRAEGEPVAGAETGSTPAEERTAAQAENVAESTAAAPEAVEVPHPATPGLTIDIPPEKAGDVLKAINEGRYNDAVGLMDDTHRTIPWDSMSDGPALKNVFAAVEDGVGRLIKGAAGVAQVPQQAIVQLARDIGGNVESLNRLYSGVTGEGGLAARITAGYNMLIASGRQLKDLAANVRDLDPASEAGAQAMLDFQKQLNLHGAIVGQVRQSSAEIGRALWAHRQLKASSDVSLSNIMDYAGNTNGTKNLKDIAKAITDAPDLESLTNAADAVNKRGFWNVVNEIGINGMLSGPKTLERNFAGLLLKSAYSMTERYVAGAIGDATRLVNSASDGASLREAVAHTAGVVEGIRSATKMAIATLKDETFASPFNPPAQRAIVSDADNLFGKSVNALGTLVRMPGRLMALMDHYSMNVGFMGDMSAQAYKQAATEADAQGLTAAARDAFMDQRIVALKANPTTEMNQHAMDAGSFMAFLETPQTPLGQPVMNFFNSLPVLKFFVAPFIHRPGNLIRQGALDYSPLGFANPNTWRAVAAGGSDGSMALARPLMGTGIALSGFGLAMDGRLTGARLGNKNTESLDGIPTYSIKLGNTWYKYNGLDPIGEQLSLIANMHEFAQRHWDPNNHEVTSALGDAAQALMESLSTGMFDHTFMKSADELFKAMGESDPDKKDAAFAKLIGENVSKFIPFSGLLGSVAQSIDPTQRSTMAGNSMGASTIASVQAKLPVLSESLPPRRDLLGRPMPVNSAWNAFAGTAESDDPMNQELSKIAVQVRPPVRTIAGYQLTPHEYDEVLTNATLSPILCVESFVV